MKLNKGPYLEAEDRLILLTMNRYAHRVAELLARSAGAIAQRRSKLRKEGRELVTCSLCPKSTACNGDGEYVFCEIDGRPVSSTGPMCNDMRNALISGYESRIEKIRLRELKEGYDAFA